MPRQKVARCRFGIFERKGFTPQVLEAIYFSVFLGKNKASRLRHHSLPASQKQSGNALHIIDEIGGIGTIHVEIDLPLFNESGELKGRRSEDDLALDN